MSPQSVDEQRCPVREPRFPSFDPTAADQNANPHPVLDRARQEAPVFYAEDLDLWIVTRHEDIQKIFRDTEAYSNANEHHVAVHMPAQLEAEVPEGWQFPLFAGVSLNVSDPPKHTRLRKLVQYAFAPRRINALKDRITSIADEIIDEFADQGHADLVGQFANPFVTRVVASILGIPRADTERFFDWADAFFQITGATDLPDEQAFKLWSSLIECDRFLRDFVQERRQSPSDDLTTDLIQARSEDGDAALTDDEVIANVIGIAVAGSDTTAILVAHTMYLLASTPEVYSQIVGGDRSLIPPLIEETMRLMSPVRGLRRTTTRDVELGGVTIPKGDDVFVHVASANRDDAVFDRPDTFDILRPNNRNHLGFGFGPHFCIGAPLARLEAQVATDRIIDRLPSFGLAPDHPPFEYNVSLRVPSLRALHVEWSPS